MSFPQKNLLYQKLFLNTWFLSGENSHLWKHNFLGTQGIIINFAFQNTENTDKQKKLNDILNSIGDNYLKIFIFYFYLIFIIMI